MYLIMEALMLISLGGMIAVFESGLSEWVIILKSAASLFFVLAGLCGYRKSKGNRKVSLYILLALCCSMAGDVFLALDTEKGIMFILGVASFAAAHVMFSIAFCKMCKIRKRDFAVTGMILGVLLVIMCVGTFDFQGLFPVVIGYAAVISFMVAKALSLWQCRQGKERAVGLMMAGGVAFLVSDMLLFFWMFGVGIPKEMQSANWIMYYMEQMFQAHALNERESLS